MTLRADYKVPGGKLIRVRIEVEESAPRARSVKIAGDFFAHPEEDFEAAESSLVGLPLDELPGKALAAFARAGFEIFGASSADIAEALRRAIDANQAP